MHIQNNTGFVNNYDQSVTIISNQNAQEEHPCMVLLGFNFNEVDNNNGKFEVQLVDLETGNISKYASTDMVSAVKQSGYPVPLSFIRHMRGAIDPENRKTEHTTRTMPHNELIKMVKADIEDAITSLSNPRYDEILVDPYFYSVDSHRTLFTCVVLRMACLPGVIDNFLDPLDEDKITALVDKGNFNIDLGDKLEIIFSNIRKAQEWNQKYKIQY